MIFLGSFDDLKIFDVVNFEDDGGDGVLVWLDLIFAVAATFRAKRAHILQVHAAFCTINLNQRAFVPDLGVCDQRNQAARQGVGLLTLGGRLRRFLLLGCRHSSFLSFA